MRKIIFTLLLAFLVSMPNTALCMSRDLSSAFGKLSGVESALKNLGKNIDKLAGADTQPDRVYAMQDMSNMCKTSKMQVHSLNSLFSVVNLVKREKKFQSKEAALLKIKCGYALNDFNRRKAFIKDILVKAKDQKLRDLAHIFDAQLNIVLKQLVAINKTFN